MRFEMINLEHIYMKMSTIQTTISWNHQLSAVLVIFKSFRSLNTELINEKVLTQLI